MAGVSKEEERGPPRPSGSPDDMIQTQIRPADLLEAYHTHLRYLRRSPHTQSHYLNAVRRFFAVYPTLTLEMVTPEQIEEYLARRPLSPASTRTELECLRAFFRWCRESKRLMKRDPLIGVLKPRVPLTVRHAPTEAELARVVSCCQTPEERLLVEGLFRTGLRLNEFRRLRWEQIDFSQRRIEVVGKGGHRRIVIWRAGEIRAFEYPRPNGFILSYFNRPWGEMRIERTLRRLGQEAGLPYKLTAHILRHGWFRAAKRRCLSLEVLAKLGGHQHISTTAMMYAPLSIDDLQEVYETGA